MTSFILVFLHLLTIYNVHNESHIMRNEQMSNNITFQPPSTEKCNNKCGHHLTREKFTHV